MTNRPRAVVARRSGHSDQVIFVADQGSVARLRSTVLEGFDRSLFEGFEIVRRRVREAASNLSIEGFEGFEMTKVRMSLAEAGDRLGIAPNSVRSRWKAGRIEGSRDNAGKIWVHLDPEEVAKFEGASNPSKPSIEPVSKGSTEGVSKGSKVPRSNPSIEGVEPFEGFEDGRVEAQAAHIETLTGQLERATSELDVLRPKVLEGERAQARAEALEATLSVLRDEREAERRSHREHVEDLRGRVGCAERREEAAQGALAVVREEAERERRRGFWGRLLRRGGLAPA